MYQSFSISTKNSKTYEKPNEDFFIDDKENHIYIVVDGVTRDKSNGVYPQPSPSKAVSEIFSKHVQRFIVEKISKYSDKQKLLYDAMVDGNLEIHRYNKNYPDYFLPGTVAIVAVIYNNTLFYSYIGDCYGMLLSDNNKFYFTKPQTALVRQHIKEFSVFEVRSTICNNIDHPYAYGVINGDPGANDFIITNQINLDNYHCLLLYSDGYEPHIQNKSASDLLSMSPHELTIDDNVFSDDDKTMIKIIW